MSTEQPQPPAASAATPASRNNWLLIGAAAVAVLAFLTLSQQRMRPPTAPFPVAPGRPGEAPLLPPPITGPQGAGPGQPGAEGLPPAPPGYPAVPVQPGQPAPNLQPVQPAIGPQPGQPVAAGPAPPADQPAKGRELTEAEMFPQLAAPNQNLPWLPLQFKEGFGRFVSFSMKGASGLYYGSVLLPDAGWERARILITKEGAEGEALSSVAYVTPVAAGKTDDGAPLRHLIPEWESDGANIGKTCVAFAGQDRGADVRFEKSVMCIMDETCFRAYVCGAVRQENQLLQGLFSRNRKPRS